MDELSTLLGLHMANAAALLWLPRGLYFEAGRAGCLVIIHLVAGYSIRKCELKLGKLAGYFGYLMFVCGLLMVIWLDVSQSFVRRFSAVQHLDCAALAFIVFVHGLLLLTARDLYYQLKKRS